MNGIRKRPEDAWTRKVRKISFMALMALIGVAGLMTGIFGPLFQPAQTVSAAPWAVGNEPWLEINCVENVVEEGGDFGLIVNMPDDVAIIERSPGPFA